MVISVNKGNAMTLMLLNEMMERWSRPSLEVPVVLLGPIAILVWNSVEEYNSKRQIKESGTTTSHGKLRQMIFPPVLVPEKEDDPMGMAKPPEKSSELGKSRQGIDLVKGYSGIMKRS